MPAPARARLLPVVSASRRVDFPACFPGELAAKLESLGPEGIHTLVLWTKNPSTLVREPLLPVLRRFESIFLHLTVTGLGGTRLEPRVPPWSEVLALVPRLDALPGIRREGICLRYDPLIEADDARGARTGNLDAGLFRGIAGEAARLGIGSIRASIVTAYPKVARRLASRGLRIAEGIGIRATGFLLEVMDPVCETLGMPLFTCVLPDRGDPGCIDGETLTRLHPRGLPCSRARDRSQRPACRCTKSLDVGSYTPCPHGCLYCYATPSATPPAP